MKASILDKVWDTPSIMELEPCGDWPEERVVKQVSGMSTREILTDPVIPLFNRVWFADKILGTNECYCFNALRAGRTACDLIAILEDRAEATP